MTFWCLRHHPLRSPPPERTLWSRSGKAAADTYPSVPGLAVVTMEQAFRGRIDPQEATQQGAESSPPPLGT